MDEQKQVENLDNKNSEINPYKINDLYNIILEDKRFINFKEILKENKKINYKRQSMEDDNGLNLDLFIDID